MYLQTLLVFLACSWRIGLATLLGSDLSGSVGTELAFEYTNSDTSSVTFTIAGGSGDADLYVKFGSAPTSSSYDCRPYKSGNAETCEFTPSQEGTYYIMIRGYSAFSGVSLSVEKESSVSGWSDLSGSAGTELALEYTNSDTAPITFTMAGGSGDADLYVKFGSAPTTSSYDCRPYKGGNAETCEFAPSKEGTYYIMVRGFSAFSGVSLSVEKEGSDWSDLSGFAGTELTLDYYNTGTSPVTFTMAGGSGDADLYVKFGSAPTTSSYDCRPYTAGNAETCEFAPSQEGTYYIMIRGYTAFSGISLSAEKESSVSNVTTMPLTAAPMSLITAVFVVLVLLNCILSAYNYKSYVAKRHVFSVDDARQVLK